MKKNINMKFGTIFTAMALMGTAMVNAAVVPSVLFSDNAVIQADREVPVWGWDNPGQAVSVCIGQTSAKGKADQNGRWEVKLPAMKSSGTPQEMSFLGSSTVTVKNVLVGQVWIGSGQSNMDFPNRWGTEKNLPEYTKSVGEANYPNFRLFKVEERWAGEPPSKDVRGKWEVCTPETAVLWPATGFFFGRELQKEMEGASVGLIVSSVGGTQINMWIPPKAVMECKPSTNPKEQELWAQSAKQMEAFYAQWDETLAKATATGNPAPTKPQPTVRRWPSCLYNGMVAPLMPYAIRGIVWYQGESNTYVKDAEGYTKMLQALVKTWRAGWKEGDIPFIIIQLPNYSEDLSTGKRANYVGLNTKVVQADPVEMDSLWAPIREAQRCVAAALPNMALVVAIDIGEQLMIHPWNKWDLGHRCALAAMNLAYGKKDLMATGPIVVGSEFKNGKVIVKFTSIGSGLTAKDNGEIKGFALAGKDGKFAWAKAVSNGNTVTLSSDEVKEPVEVRYAWAENPTGNLINKEGFPASPFKMDEAASQKKYESFFATYQSQQLHSMKYIIAILGLAGSLILPMWAEGETAQSLTQYGITWTFDKPYTVGKFVTGDWWVVGPVTVVKVDPAPKDGRNGSMINPKSSPAQEFKQAYDNRCGAAASDKTAAQFYDEKLAVKFPVVLNPAQSLVSAVSQEKVCTAANQLKPDSVPISEDVLSQYYFRLPLRSAAVLTCLDKAPPADAFRPQYLEGKKTIYTVSQIRRNILPHLPVPAGAIPPDCNNREKSIELLKNAQKKAFSDRGMLPRLCGMPSTAIQERELQRVSLDYVGENANNSLPVENTMDCGREITTIVSTVGLMLLLDDPKGEHEQLLRLFIQRGIDYWGVIGSCNHTWHANGMIDNGRKWPVMFAGLMLGDPEMAKAEAANAEDESTYYGEGHRGLKVLCRIQANWTNEELPPEKWKEGRFANTIGNGWRAENYRLGNGPTLIGQALAARLMGARGLWNHDAYFDYVERWIKEGDYGTYVQPGGDFKASSAQPATPEEIAMIKPKKYQVWPSASDFVRLMWETYRDKADQIGEETKAKWSQPGNKK